ncbi:MAG: class I SAM-dependent methyltransferase [Rhodovibrionaceae bacterium]|nr:class I SAM-dependent methyltransferase [Rhodovibrionaceae bacterium]
MSESVEGRTTSSRRPRRDLGEAAYSLAQAARVGVYLAQYRISDRLTKPVEPDRKVRGPGMDRVLTDLRELLARDWDNVRAGLYRAPHDLVTGPVRALARARTYFRDLREVERRRHARANSEVLTEETRGRYPRYYLQNFHYQSGGWLSRESAKLYDHQVEVLFVGGSDAMRRQVLVPLHAFLKDRRTADTKLIDIACGTGRFLTFVKDNYPRLNVTALDLSEAYLEEARAALSSWRRVDYLAAQAEAPGLPAESHDVATCTYLFHELPREVRRQVAEETFRILKPGGLLLFMDSIQKGDEPDYDGLLDHFPVSFHEPYYADYVASDLDALFRNAGFEVEGVERHYFSRLMVLRKPA